MPEDLVEPREKDDAQEAPGLKVYRIINRLVESANGENKAYYLPLMCGAGKSLGISRKIRESIEKNEGLLVITDRKHRLNDYLSPGIVDDLTTFLQAHAKSVAILTSETVEKVRNTHQLSLQSPVL